MARNNYKDESWIGQKFDEVTIIGISENRTSDNKVKWNCSCSCGRLFEIAARNLLKKNYKTCGKCSVNDYKDEKWVGWVNKDTGVECLKILPAKNNCVYWLCKCPRCGSEYESRAVTVYRGTNKGCSCTLQNHYSDEKWVGWVNPKTGVKVIEICEGARRKIVKGKEKNARVQWICWCPVCEKLFDKPVDAIDVYSGRRESCGCKRDKKLYDENRWSGYKNESTGIEFIGVIPERITNKVWWNCRCFCGNEFKAPAANIVNGHTKSCGCLQSTYKDMSKWYGYVNDYGVKVLSVSDKTDDDGDTFWNCECSCGNIITRKAYKVVSGDIKTCGCLEIFDSPDKNNYNNPKWDGYVFPNGIIVLKRMKKGGTIKWLCKCHCGNEWEVQADLIVKGKQKSCGCELSISKGHKQIQELLVSNNVLFELEKTFTDLYSLKNRPLRFDFSIENGNGDLLALVEYDGEQHYDFTVFKRLSRGHATYEDFLEAQERDKQKDDYAREHNIPLYRIPYTYTPEQIEARVLEILKELNLI